MKHLPIIIVLLPLCSALLSLALSKIQLHLGRNILIVTLAATVVCALIQVKDVVQNGSISYNFGNYKMPLGIEFTIDSVSALLIALITIMGFITILYCMGFEKTTDPLKVGGAYAMIALLVTGMVGMTSTGDVFNLYVFLEITSLSGYCLIALGGSRGIVSAFRYMLIGTVAASFYLLGIGILYASTGTLNMADMAFILNKGNHDQAMLVSMCLFIVAFGIKMALFPFHGWQPSAYTHAEVGARPIIAGVMGKIPAYALFRYMFCVFGKDFTYIKQFLIILGVLSAIGMIYGSVRAMAQKDIRKLLAYSSIAQISYISLGFAIGNPLAISGAFLHMFGHAFMKGGLFFVAGAIMYKYGTVELENFGQIYKKMPLTAGLAVVASLSMIGIPPTVGFFSKWYLAIGAATAHEYVYIAILVISSLLNAIYFFKVLEDLYMNKNMELPDNYEGKARELPINMIIPIVVCFIAIICLGIFNTKIVEILMFTIRGVAL